MTIELTLAEIETHLNMSADDRSRWHVYSEDPVMQKRLESADAVLDRVSGDGIGKHYTLRTDQVIFRKGKRTLSDERRAELAERMRSLRQPQPSQ